jgi:OOP family OmpA-OmpF porin
MTARSLHLGWLVAASVAFSASALADATIPTADIEGASDNALLKRYEGSFIVSFERQDYTDFEIPASALKPSADPDARDAMNNMVFEPETEIEVEGTLTRLAYVLPEDRSPLEVLRNYQDVVEEGGGKLLFECKQEECGGDPQKSSSGGGGEMSLMQYFVYESELKDESYSNGNCALTQDINDQRFFSAEMPVPAGKAYVTVHTYQLIDDLYCKELNGRTIAVVHVLEPKDRDQKMVVVDAGEMEVAIAATGSISLYGIFFDFDKADVKPESEPTLGEISKLMTADPDLAVVVVGHTDNKGSFDYNLDLSARRSQAVRDALISKYAIAPERLTAAGAGMMAPVASNDTEDGRAKNRRVVLVKVN